MPSVVLSSVSFSYTSAHTVLSDAEFSLAAGWTGLVGNNGSGKSTLLSLIAGRLRPVDGVISIDSAVSPLLCEQTVERCDLSIRSFAESWDPPDYALRGRLDLDPPQLGRWSTLSPGERKRWQIGAALSSRPDILLLDEPTNHLDSESRELLSGALEEFAGVGMLVSHDRDLLDALTTSTVRIDKGRVKLWAGAYSAASVLWQEEGSAAAEQYETDRKRLARTERRVADQRRSMEERSASFARRMQSAAARDHDTHSTARKEKHRSGSSSASRSLSSVVAEKRRLEMAMSSHDVSRSVGGTIRFDGDRSPRPVLVRLEGRLEIGGSTLVEDATCLIERDARIHLRGRNGSGKSTLLSAIAKGWDLSPERLMYLPQESTRSDGLELLGRLAAMDTRTRGRVLQIVARLGADPDVLLSSALPSPGETRKLAMAMGIGVESWMLLLDEPTNHLDLDTVERLEAALKSYPGAMLMVSHDHRFAGALTDQEWSLEGGVLQSGGSLAR